MIIVKFFRFSGKIKNKNVDKRSFVAIFSSLPSLRIKISLSTLRFAGMVSGLLQSSFEKQWYCFLSLLTIMNNALMIFLGNCWMDACWRWFKTHFDATAHRICRNKRPGRLFFTTSEKGGRLFRQIRYRTDFFPGWNVLIGARNSIQPEKTSGKNLLSSSFLEFKSAYLLVLHQILRQMQSSGFFFYFFSFFMKMASPPPPPRIALKKTNEEIQKIIKIAPFKKAHQFLRHFLLLQIFRKTMTLTRVRHF